MTAESGECNRRSEGSKAEFEAKGGGDLKDDCVAGGGGIACRGDGEEIGGSFVIVNGDSGDRSDRSDLDPATKSVEIGGKEEPLAAENEKNEGLVGVRSNGDEVGEEQNVVGSGSDAKVGQEADALVAEPEEEPKSEEVETEETSAVGVEEREEGVGPLESGSGVEIEPKEDEIVEEAGAEEEEEELLPLEEVEAEAMVVNGESESRGELGSEIGNDNITEPETGEPEAASRVEEEQEPDKGDGGVINVAVAVAVAGYTENAAEVESTVEAEPKEEANAEVETQNVTELESAVREEQKEESTTEAAEVIEKLAELGSAVEVESEQQPSTVAEEMDKAEVEEAVVPKVEVEDNGNPAEVKRAVEVESEQQPSTAAEEMDKAEVEEAVEPKAEVEDNGNPAEVKWAVEVESEQQPSTAAEEMDKAEVEDAVEPEVKVEDNGNPAEVERAAEVEPERESETALDTADNVEAEERKEHEAAVVAENTASGHLPLENGGAGIPRVADDAPIDEPSGQPENGSADSSTDIRADTLKDELNGETRNIPLENAESTAVSHAAEKELVEEVGCSTDGEHVELEVSNGVIVQSEPKTDVSNGDIEPLSSDSVTSVDLEPVDKDTEVELKDSVEDVETNKDVAVNRMKVESKRANESAESSECVDISIEGDQSTNKDGEEEATHEQVHAAETIQVPPETHVVKQSIARMVKVPWFINDELQKQIQDAQEIVDQKTKIRDDLGVKTRKKEEEVYQWSLDYKAELAKERAAQAIYNAKRQEVDRMKEKISWINSANSISDIDEKIRSMVHKQQHETISLKQEKQYIHDINQMKRFREQLSSKKASQEEIDEALKQRDEIEASFNILKKELDSKRAACSSAENSTKAAWTKYRDEEKSLKKLKEERNAADGVRQEAYSKLWKLRNESAEKAKYFKMYKADQSVVANYKFSGDSQGLRTHCNKQVEKMMDLWNNNAEFREQYVKSNMYNTLKKLGTSDGRRLGPGEEAQILRSHVDKSPSIISAPSSNIQSPAPVLVAEVRQGNLTESTAAKQVARTNQSAKLESSTKFAPAGDSMPTVSNSAESRGEDKEKNKVKKEEEEMARKAEELARKEEELRKAKAAKEEELRKEKAAAQLKEQLRLEQKAKAREAEERKRRKAEKAQAKAEYRSQKEAELKEKKKAKKENTKSGVTDMPNGGTQGVSSPAPETNLQETFQAPGTSSGAVSRKRSAKPASSMRQYNKVQAPLPLPLRNRGKRKMLTWMWVLLVILMVLVLFVAGNYISFSTSGMPEFGF